MYSSVGKTINHVCLCAGGRGDAVMSSSNVKITMYVSVRAVVFTCS